MFKPPITIVKNSEVVDQESICMLGYGPAGAGKTFFAGTAGERAIIIDIGKGTTTLRSPEFKAKVGTNPTIVQLNESAYMPIDKITSDNNTLDILTDTIDFLLEKHLDDFDTMIVDEATALRRMAMQKGMVVGAELRGGKAVSTFKRWNIELADPTDYFIEMEMTEQIISTYVEKFKSIQKHLIIMAHERHTYGKAPKLGEAQPLIKLGPGFTGKTHPDDIEQYFDLVWHFEVVGGGNNKVYRIRTSGDEILKAKTRYGGIFNELESNLTWPEVVRRITEKQFAVAKDRSKK